MDFITQELSQDNGPVVLIFTSQHCAPCIAIKPKIEALSDKYGVRTKYIDVMLFPKAAQMFNIRSTPSLVLFQDQKSIQSVHGSSMQDIEDLFQSASEAV